MNLLVSSGSAAPLGWLSRGKYG